MIYGSAISSYCCATTKSSDLKHQLFTFCFLDLRQGRAALRQAPLSQARLQAHLLGINMPHPPWDSSFGSGVLIAHYQRSRREGNLLCPWDFTITIYWPRVLQGHAQSQRVGKYTPLNSSRRPSKSDATWMCDSNTGRMWRMWTLIQSAVGRQKSLKTGSSLF